MPRVSEHENQKKATDKAKERFEQAKEKTRRVWGESEFEEQLKLFETQWLGRDCPNPFDSAERCQEWDGSKRHVIYSGLYYDLRDLCDSFGLEWPHDGNLVMRYLRLCKEKRNPNEAFEPNKCPPQHAWQWFRMAQTGLCLPRDSELKHKRQLSNHSRNRKTSRGLTYDEIVQISKVSTRTVQNAINACWQYLEHGGNLDEVAKLAGLKDMEILALVFAIDSRQQTRQQAEK